MFGRTVVDLPCCLSSERESGETERGSGSLESNESVELDRNEVCKGKRSISFSACKSSSKCRKSGSELRLANSTARAANAAGKSYRAIFG